MKMAKTYKFILLTIAFFASIILSFGLYAPNVVKAQNVSASTYFRINGVESTSIEFKNDNLVATIGENDVVSTINKLALDNFAVNFNFDTEKVAKFKISFELPSFDANGNKNSTTGAYDKDILFEILIDTENSTAIYNSAEPTNININNNDFVVELESKDNFIKASVNNQELSVPVFEDVEYKDYYKVKDYDCVVSTLNFTLVELKEEAPNAEVNFTYFDQFNKDGNTSYKQEFKLNAEGDGFESLASPIISLYEGFNGGSNNVKCGIEITVNPTAYALLQKITAKKLTLASEDENVKIFGQKIAFKKAGEGISFDVQSEDGSVTYLTKIVNVIDKDKEAPKYLESIDDNSSVMKSFKAKLESSLIQEDGKYVAVGSGEYLVLPSFENFVTDNLDGYSSLTPIVYYHAPNTTTIQSYTASISELKIPIPSAGQYEFFVAFKDKTENAMQKEDFYLTVDEGKVPRDYINFVFSFEIKDNTDIIITPKSVGSGFVGVEYIAPGFTITASSYTQEYTLWYRKDALSEWVNIPKSSSVTDENYNEDGYTYNDIKKANTKLGAT